MSEERKPKVSQAGDPDAFKAQELEKTQTRGRKPKTLNEDQAVEKIEKIGEQAPAPEPEVKTSDEDEKPGNQTPAQYDDGDNGWNGTPVQMRG